MFDTFTKKCTRNYTAAYTSVTIGRVSFICLIIACVYFDECNLLSIAGQFLLIGCCSRRFKLFHEKIMNQPRPHYQPASETPSDWHCWWANSGQIVRARWVLISFVVYMYLSPDDPGFGMLSLFELLQK